MTMDESRITKKIFSWDFSLCNRNWGSEVKNILTSINNEYSFYHQLQCNVDTVRTSLHNLDCEQWTNAVFTSPKLRTYRIFKTTYGTEIYLKSIHNRQQRSILAQFRCGILPLALETGRFTNTVEQERLCLLCNRNEIESEMHFLLECPKYETLREEYVRIVSEEFINFRLLSIEEKLTVLMSDKLIKTTAKYIFDCFDLRRHSLYTES